MTGVLPRIDTLIGYFGDLEDMSCSQLSLKAVSNKGEPMVFLLLDRV